MKRLNCILILEDTDSLNPDFRCPPSIVFFHRGTLSDYEAVPHIILPIFISAFFDHTREQSLRVPRAQLREGPPF